MYIAACKGVVKVKVPNSKF